MKCSYVCCGDGDWCGRQRCSCEQSTKKNHQPSLNRNRGGKQLRRWRNKENQTTGDHNEMVTYNEMHLELHLVKAHSWSWVGFAQPWSVPWTSPSTLQPTFLQSSFGGLSFFLTVQQACWLYSIWISPIWAEVSFHVHCVAKCWSLRKRATLLAVPYTGFNYTPREKGRTRDVLAAASREPVFLPWTAFVPAAVPAGASRAGQAVNKSLFHNDAHRPRAPHFQTHAPLTSQLGEGQSTQKDAFLANSIN